MGLKNLLNTLYYSVPRIPIYLHTPYTLIAYPIKCCFQYKFAWLQTSKGWLRFALLKRCSLKSLMQECSVGTSFTAPARVTGWIPGFSVASVSGHAVCSLCLAGIGLADFSGMYFVGKTFWSQGPVCKVRRMSEHTENGSEIDFKRIMFKSPWNNPLHLQLGPPLSKSLFSFLKILFSAYFQLISQLLKYKNISLGGTSRLNQKNNPETWCP